MVSKEKLIELRKQRDMTQAEVAEFLGVSAQAVSRWEQGTSQPAMKNMFKLSQLYQVDLGVLTGQEAPLPEEPEPPAEPEPPEQEELQSGKPAHWKYLLWPVCLLAACIVVCATILILQARPWAGQNEKEVVPIEEVNRSEIEILPEERVELGPW